MPQLGMEGLNEEPMEEDPVASLMDNLTGVDADADGWDAFDELISDHSDSDPDDLPTQDEVDDALGKLDQLGWDEFKGTLTKNQDIINAPHEKPTPSEPQMEMPGMPPGMMGMGMTGMGMGMPPGMMGMGMPGMPGAGGPTAPAPGTTDMTKSITGHISNQLYDVVLLDLDISYNAR